MKVVISFVKNASLSKRQYHYTMLWVLQESASAKEIVELQVVSAAARLREYFAHLSVMEVEVHREI